MELLLIRHAQTTSNVSGAMDTAHPGADLTALGRRQATELAEHLAGERIDSLLVSPRQRTRSTAAPLAESQGLEPQLRDGLVEISAGEWEMSADETHRVGYVAAAASWLGGAAAPDVPSGEDLQGVLARFDLVVAEVVASGHERVAIVSHGAVLRIWCGLRVPGVDRPSVRERALPNTAIIRLARTDGAWEILEWDAREITLDDAPDPWVGD